MQINLCYENIILRKCIKQDGKLKNHVVAVLVTNENKRYADTQSNDAHFHWD